ncbi:MAG TPA: hypothetical protein VJT73_21400 [Polyangiaceae bacterium]|nr:hypothetical protein [Polyangiaceae bacterium]
MALGSIRWVLWGLCFAVVLFAARPASAAAPMCDERGVSVAAPAPVLPMRDIRLEAASTPACDDALIRAVFANAPQAHGQPRPVADAPDEAWITPAAKARARSESTRCEAFGVGALPIPAGFRRGVFRPPR